MNSDKAQESSTPEGISLAEFLESVPPGRTAIVTDTLQVTTRSHQSDDYSINLPDLHLHCTSEACNGLRFFAPTLPYNRKTLEVSTSRSPDFQFLHYTCRNCGRSRRVFSVSARLTTDKTTSEIHKLGEVPPFGPPTPPRLITLIGGDRELFLKGRRAENQALGIAAFAYYRRVVENQKAKILGEMLRVATMVNAEVSLIEELKAAQAESQFSKAIEMIKHGIPQASITASATCRHSA